jgi:hypothetical protein
MNNGPPAFRSLQLAALLIDDPSILDMDDAIRKGQQPRVMRHDQHGVFAFPGDFGKYLHDRLAILAIECGGRFVGKNDGRISDNGPGDRDALLLAAAELSRIRLYFMGQPDLGQCLA